MTLAHDRPCAAPPLDSYRYRGPYGWIMVGAFNNADALREVARSTDAPIDPQLLQKWDGAKYVTVYPTNGLD